MKNTLLAVSLFTTLRLFAADQIQNPTNEPPLRENPCECPPCCPKPKECIDCEAYTPAYYDLQCAWGANLSVDFLYWFARETNLPFALEVTNQNLSPGAGSNAAFAPVQSHYINAKWSPGFRIGLGWNSSCDGWDLNVNWTWVKNRKRNTFSTDFYTPSGDFNIPAVSGQGIINPWINASFISEAGNINTQVLSLTSVRAKWRLLLNQIDLEFGRKYWLSRHFTLRPYAGVRGAWTKTRFETLSLLETGLRFPSNNLIFNLSDQFKDRFWGVGILVGVQPNWYLNCENTFAIFANLDASLIYGKYSSRKKENYFGRLIQPTSTTSETFIDSSKSSFFMIEPIIDLALGFSWQENWSNDRYRIELDLGWEHHIWFNSNHRMLTEVPSRVMGSGRDQGGFRAFDTVKTDLSFGGLVVRVKFDF